VGSTHLHTWVRLEDFTWLPNNCAIPEISQHHAIKCLLQKKLVLFEGDSHMRMLYNSLLTFVCGPQVDWTGWNTQCGGACRRQKLSNVCMRKDGTASSHNFMDTSAYMTFVNFGAHFCHGSNHKKSQDYRNKVDDLVQRIKKMDQASKSKVIWHETNMIPIRDDNWIKAYGDQRTNIKLAAYNLYHRNPFPCAALVSKNRLLGLSNFLGGKMDPFS